MNIPYYFELVKSYALDNPIIALVVIAVLAIFAYKKPENALKGAAFIALVIVGLYVFSSLGDSSFKGVQDKKGGSMKAIEAMKE